MKYIYGLNKSGESIIDYLDSINENYYCWDDNKKIRDRLIIKNKTIKLIKPLNLKFELFKECFITPGISLNNPKLNILKKNKLKLFRDLELYSRLSTDKKIIAITGTNGKSTTTKLISKILEINNILNFAGGNLGIPLLDFKKDNKKINLHVIELSSFQLESFISFNSYISILLNLSPDHLDRYNSFEEYISVKTKIINSNKKGYNIIAVDDPYCFSIYNNNKSKIIPISINPIKKGIYFSNTEIVDNFFENNQIIDLSKISPSLFGSFNKQNILAAYVVNKILKLDTSNFLKVIKNFKGLSHRLEKIYQNKYLQIINNSKATNVDAAIKSIMNYDNINLILGGKAKEKDFTKIILYKNKINKIYLIGESSTLIYRQLQSQINCVICENLKKAIKDIFIDLRNNNNFHTILFSPACTSYDQFENYEKRGLFFKKLVTKIINE